MKSEDSSPWKLHGIGCPGSNGKTDTELVGMGRCGLMALRKFWGYWKQTNRHWLSLTHQGNIRICMQVISYPGVRVQENTSLSFPLERPASWLMTGWRGGESKSTKGWRSWAVVKILRPALWWCGSKCGITPQGRGCLFKTQFQGLITDLENQISGSGTGIFKEQTYIWELLPQNGSGGWARG